MVVRCAVYAILPFYLFPHTDFEWVKLLLSEKGDADKPRKYAVSGFLSRQQNYALNVRRIWKQIHRAHLFDGIALFRKQRCISGSGRGVAGERKVFVQSLLSGISIISAVPEILL